MKNIYYLYLINTLCIYLYLIFTCVFTCIYRVRGPPAMAQSPPVPLVYPPTQRNLWRHSRIMLYSMLLNHSKICKCMDGTHHSVSIPEMHKSYFCCYIYKVLVVQSSGSLFQFLVVVFFKQRTANQELQLESKKTEPHEKPVRFAVQSLGWVRIAEEDLTPERSSRAVNKCIVDLSFGRNDINDVVGRWGDVSQLSIHRKVFWLVHFNH